MPTIIRSSGGGSTFDSPGDINNASLGTIQWSNTANAAGSGSLTVPAGIEHIIVVVANGGTKLDKYTMAATNSNAVKKLGSTTSGGGFYVHNGLDGNGAGQSVHQIFTTTHGALGVKADVWFIALQGIGSTITIAGTESGNFYRVDARIINIDPA